MIAGMNRRDLITLTRWTRGMAARGAGAAIQSGPNRRSLHRPRRRESFKKENSAEGLRELAIWRDKHCHLSSVCGKESWIDLRELAARASRLKVE